MGIPGVSVTEASGIPPLPDTGVLSRVAMVAPSLAGTFDAKPIYALSDLSEFSQGVLVRHGKHLFAETKVPFLAVRCAATNPGTYETIDNSEFTGTAVPAVVASAVPTDEAELYVKIVDGGVPGTTGITFRRSDSNSREGAESMPLRALGTSTRITFTDVNAAIDLCPPETELVALANDLKTSFNAHIVFLDYEAELVARANDIKTQYEAHRVLTSGGVHGLADSTNTISSPDATDIASSITLLNELRTDYEAHRALTTGSVHGGVDGVNTITAGVATNGYTAVLLAIDLAAKYEEHRVKTTGAVHGAADTVNVITEADPDYVHGLADSANTVATADATNTATAIVLLNVIRTKYEAHRVLLSGVHGAADSTNTISAPAATNGVDGRTLANELQTDFNAHIVLTAGVVHNQADATNASAADVVSAGTVVAGDIIRVNTNAPTPADSDITAAIAKLVDSASTPAMVLFPGRTVAGLGSTIKLGATAMTDAGKPCAYIVQPRKPGVGESSEDHVNAIDDEWTVAVTDNRICVVNGDYLCTFNDGAKLRQRLTGTATHETVRAVNTEYFRTTWQTIALDKVTIHDAEGAVIGWDEANTPDKPRKVQVFYRVPAGDRPLVPAVDYTLADLDNDRTTTLRERRVTDELHRTVRKWSFAQIGALAATTIIPNTATGRLNESVRLSFQQSLAAIIAANMGGAVPDVAISDTGLPDLVAINPVVGVVGAIVTLAITVNYTVIGAVGRINTVLSVRTGS